jgi:hypothetical protein
LCVEERVEDVVALQLQERLSVMLGLCDGDELAVRERVEGGVGDPETEAEALGDNEGEALGLGGVVIDAGPESDGDSDTDTEGVRGGVGLVVAVNVDVTRAESDRVHDALSLGEPLCDGEGEHEMDLLKELNEGLPVGDTDDVRLALLVNDGVKEETVIDGDSDLEKDEVGEPLEEDDGEVEGETEREPDSVFVMETVNLRELDRVRVSDGE